MQRWWYTIPLRLRSLFRKTQVEHELDEELRFHLDRQTEANLALGLQPTDARRAALRGLRDIEVRKEECRDARGTVRAESLFADLRYALRGMRRSPAFTAVAIATLALGIGANSAIFSVANGMLLRRLPVRAPEQLVLLSETDGRQARTRTSYQVYQSLRQSAAFAGMAATSVERSVWIGPSHAEFINVEIVTGNYFETLAIRPLLGRPIQPADDRVLGAHPVAVLSHAFWASHFGSDPGILERTISLAGGTFRIIGVSPPNFRGLEIDEPADIWVPLMMTEQIRPGFQPWKPIPRSTWLHLIGRLNPGVSRESAEAAATLAYREGRKSAAPSQVRIALMPAHRGFSAIRTQFSQPLLVLTVAVGFVLFVACINVASMLLARTAARRREIAMRVALGATAGRLAQQFLVEALLLALLGGVAGLLLAFTLAPPLLRFLLAGTDPSAIEVRPDLNVIGLTIAVSALTGVLFSLGPARSAAKPNVSFTWRNTMAIAQIAISLIILIAAGLFVRTLRNLQAVDLGFTAQNVSLLEFYPHLSGYSEQDTRRFFQELVDQLGRAPGVSSVSYANLYSFNLSSERTSVSGDGIQGGETEAETSYVGPKYFKTLGVAIVRGREFTAQECGGSEKNVAIVSQALARELFGDADPIGRRLHRPPYSQTVIGVAADVKYNSLREAGPAILYTPGIWGYTTVIVRTLAPAAKVSGMIRREVERIDKRVPVRRFTTLQDQVDASLRTERLLASLSGAFGVLVAFLAGVGVYGVVSYSVNSRTAEFGIRMALGATRARVVWLVLRGTLATVFRAVAIGIPLSLGLMRFLSGMLFGLSPSDPWTVGVAVVMIACAVLIATWVPAVRAAGLDAAEALRRG